MKQRLFETIKQWFELMGYSRAAAELARQGLHEEAKRLMLDRAKLEDKMKLKHMARIRLARVHTAKRNYEPGDHYMRGKSVAFWRGKATKV
jgi:hypothetical protein